MGGHTSTDSALCERESRNAHGHFTRAILYDNLQEKCQTPILRHTFCASLRSRNAHEHLEKWAGTPPGTALCASLHSRNAHGHFRRTILIHFVSKFTGKMGEDTSGDSVLCEPAQSKCTWTFQKNHFDPFCIKIYRKNGRGHLRGQRFVRACAVEMYMDI